MSDTGIPGVIGWTRDTWQPLRANLLAWESAQVTRGAVTSAMAQIHAQDLPAAVRILLDATLLQARMEDL